MVHLLTGSLLALFALITIVFSLTVLLMIIWYWRPKCRSIGNLLACNSSATLIFYAITVSIQIPFVVRSEAYPASATDLKACKAFASLLFCASTVKAYSYLVQAISRFFITILPKHRYLHSFRTNCLLILTSWIASVMIAAGMLLSSDAYQYESESRLCIMTVKHFLTSFTSVVAVFLTSVCSIIILYGIVLYRTVQYSRTTFNSLRQLQFKRGMAVFRKILIFVSILLVSGTFYVLSVILNVVAHVPWPLFSVSILFISLGATAESIALFFTNPQLRRLLSDKFKIVLVTRFLTYMRRTDRVGPTPGPKKIVQARPRIT